MNRTATLAVALCTTLICACEQPTVSSTAVSGDATTEELKRLEEAANGGDSEAMYSLFLAIAQRGTDAKPISEEERKQAVLWLERAGKLENWRAAFVLSLFYEHGTFGFQKSPKDKAYWSAIFEKNKPKTKEP